MATFDKAARKAASKGASPGQGIPNARIPSVRSYVSQAHFGAQKPPVAPRDQLYPGTKRFTKIQKDANGQDAPGRP
jgi:hypothetical protein